MGNRLIAILFLLLASTTTTEAQDDPPDYPLFADPAPLGLRIVAPFGELVSELTDRPEFDATLELTGPDAEGLETAMRIRVRGNSRVLNCDFPPLALDLPRNALGGTVFEGQNELKLVTLCKNSSSYRRYLEQEFLVYRMFGLLTDRSFRVRWAEVEFIYSDSRRPRSLLAPAFLIEEVWEVAARNRLEVVEREHVAVSEFDPVPIELLMVFQYLIGNADFEARQGPDGDDCCHNAKIIGRSGEPLVLVPYDFDNSGMIDAEYAVPNERLPIGDVTTRLYRGFCTHNENIPAAIASLNARRDAMLALLVESGEEANRRAIRYLEDSFERINEPRRVESDLIGKCIP